MNDDATIRCPAGGPAISPMLGATGLAALVLLAALAGGCADSGGKAIVLQDKAEFDQVALHADKPALVMFYKGGCASCAALEPTFDKLAGEYAGRAVVAKFMILTFVFGVTSPELKEKYDVVFVPHVVLLVNGQEKKHWIMDYNIDDYRKALDQYVRPAGAEGGSAGERPAGMRRK